MSQPAYDGAPSRSALAAYLERLRVRPSVSPGLDADAPQVDGPGDGRYALGHELGHGGSATVLLGADRHLRRAVAIKVLPEADTRDPDLVQAFLEEAVITGGLTHPNIVPAFDLAWSPEIGLYYTMKRLTGRSLERVLADLRAGYDEARRTFTMFRLLGILVEIARALAYAHSRDVIHTDLKPANVLIGDQGEVAVADWGLAQVTGPEGRRQARARLLGGTPAYMSPEQIDSPSTKLDAQTDIWALGVILYEMLTLSRPFSASTVPGLFTAIATDPIIPPSERAPERNVPRALDAICLRALKRNRVLRYQSVREMLGEIDAYLEGTRERMRREEEVRNAVEGAKKELDALAFLERTADHTGDRSRETSERLLRGYERALTLLRPGFAAIPEDEHLGELAGDLYWRVFQRVMPASRVAPAIQAPCLELLGTLCQLALPAVVHEGRRRVADPDLGVTEEARGDPWLSVVMAFCASEEQAEREASVTSSLVARVAFLKRVPLFSRLPSAELLPIAAASLESKFSAGEVLFEEGALGTALYVVMEGTIDILRSDALLSRLSVGEVFGEVAVLAESTRTATAVAHEPARCLVLEGPRFREILRKHGEIGLAVIQVLNDRLRAATEREAALRAGLTTLPR